MRLFVITMEDPVYTLPFLKDVIRQRSQDVIGVAVTRGGRLKIGKQRSKFVYLFTLLLIMGVPHFAKYAWITLSYKIRKRLAAFTGRPSPSILHFARDLSIPTFEINTPNNREFLEKLRGLKPDIIVNQSQSILKKELLDIPRIGVLNRHNALLPKNRGRLTPFWVLAKGEAETGVSIHFVEEGIDSGDIIVQERFVVSPRDTFNSIVRKNYEIAPQAMLKAIDKLEQGDRTVISNDDQHASYNSVPTLFDALQFRLNRMRAAWL